MGVHIVFRTRFVNRDAFKNEILGVIGFHRTGLKNRIDHPVLIDPILDQIDMEIEPPRGLNGATEGNLPIPL